VAPVWGAVAADQVVLHKCYTNVLPGKKAGKNQTHKIKLPN